MFRETKTLSPEIDRLIERQMRNWEIARQQKLETERRAVKPVEDFISMSRAIGIAGDDVAATLSERLGWPTFDRQLLQAMAGDNERRRQLYATMDERDRSWLEECLVSMGGGEFAKNDYFHRLRETVLALARKGHAIFLGRATDLILPKGVGLRVRLTASHEYRIHRYAESQKITNDQAEKQFEELERERTKYILHHFGAQDTEPTRHDLIINMERFSAQQAAELILTAMRLRGMGT